MTDRDLDEALSAAHLPSLAAALVHLTGDAGLVGRDRWPVYDFFGDSKLGGYSAERQAELRAAARRPSRRTWPARRCRRSPASKPSAR